MKMAIISSLYPPAGIGGAEKSVQYLGEGLVSAGHEVVLITLAPDRKRTLHWINGVKVLRLPLSNLYFPFPSRSRGQPTKAVWHTLDTYNLLMQRSVGSILEEEEPDIVNTHNIAGFSTSVWAAAKSNKLPLVHTIRDHYLLCPRTTMHRNGRNCQSQCVDCRLFSTPRLSMSKLPNVAIGISNYILKQHLTRGYFPEAKSAVIYNGYPLPPDLPEPATSTSRPFRFGFLGRIHETKGIEDLVAAFLAFPNQGAQLWIAGSGSLDDEEKLLAKVEADTRIRLLGEVLPSSFLPKIDVLVVPSVLREAFGRVALEAFAHARPIITTGLGGLGEIASPDTSWRYHAGDRDALQARFEYCASHADEVHQKGRRARARAQDFSQEKNVREYLELFSSLLHGS